MMGEVAVMTGGGGSEAVMTGEKALMIVYAAAITADETVVTVGGVSDAFKRKQ